MTFRHVDTEAMAWEPEPTIRGMFSKTLHIDPASGAATHLMFIPPDYGANSPRRPTRHFHRTVVERALCLGGDYPHWEFGAPADTTGQLVVFRKGTFMDRPPLSLHGLHAEPRPEIGATMLSWASGGGVGLDDPKARDETQSVPFAGYHGINQTFVAPRIFGVDSLAWVPHSRVTGWRWKALAPKNGAAPACALVHVPADWRPSPSLAPPAAVAERCWMFALSGDVGVQVRAQGRTTDVRLIEGGYLEWQGPATLGFSEQPVSDCGAVLLCVGHPLA
ncbi:MAG: hypothetical protein EXQ85_02875 [Alphaproteobacteria bacterium]|nr:hypothetical protein [Alphaproteobacteria bacterium]